MTEKFLRVQGWALANLELKNQNGPIHRQLVEVFVTDSFAQPPQEEVQRIALVFDANQLSRLRDQLLALELPTPPIEPRALVQ